MKPSTNIILRIDVLEKEHPDWSDENLFRKAILDYLDAREPNMACAHPLEKLEVKQNGTIAHGRIGGFQICDCCQDGLKQI